MQTESRLLDHEVSKMIDLAVESQDVRHFESRIRVALKNGKPAAAKTAAELCKKYKRVAPGGYEAEAVKDGLLVVTPDGRIEVITWGKVVDRVLAFADEDMI